MPVSGDQGLSYRVTQAEPQQGTPERFANDLRTGR
jgi:hypothetical protein